jgi:hypothetical protein
MNYEGDYGILKSKNNMFIILSDVKLLEYIKDLESITKVNYSNQQIILKTEEPLYLPIKNTEDLFLLNTFSEKYLTILNGNSEAVKILEIEDI